MATVISDIIEGRLRHSADGYEQERGFIVTGLAGVTSASGRWFAAMTTLGVPALYDPHPDLPFMTVKDQTSEPYQGDVDAFKVTCIYSGDIINPTEPIDEGVITVGGSVQSVRTFYDDERTQTLGFLEYQPATPPGGPAPPPIKKPIEVEVPVPMVILSFERMELGSPGEKSFQYQGTVNSTTFATFPARKWLCTHLSGTSTDGGINYLTRYEFQLNRQTWDVETVIRINGEVPEDWESQSLAWKLLRWSPERDFNALELPGV